MTAQEYRSPLRHLAIIMDGNGRWAKERGLPRSAGHKAGTEAAKAIVTESRKIGLEYLTLYAFSKENWSRPHQEINFLFDLLVKFLRQEQKTLIEQSIKLQIIGNWQELPFTVRQALKATCAKTEECDQMVLNLALNYSGRDEILYVCRCLLRDKIMPEQLDERVFRQYLFTQYQPDPDLIIRTSGEKRLSNYLIFQSAYSELYFTSVLWPDFDEQALHQALNDYSHRQRRFGGLGDA
jgi:undecaprenyl diphosphate synthase